MGTWEFTHAGRTASDSTGGSNRKRYRFLHTLGRSSGRKRTTKAEFRSDRTLYASGMNWTRAKRTCVCVVLVHPRPRKSARAMRSNLPPRLTYPESASGEPSEARLEETAPETLTGQGYRQESSPEDAVDRGHGLRQTRCRPPRGNALVCV